MENHTNVTTIQGSSGIATERQPNLAATIPVGPASMPVGSASMTLDAKYAQFPNDSWVVNPHATQDMSEWMYRSSLLLIDALLVGLAFALAYWLRFKAGITLEPNVDPQPDLYMRLVLVLIPVWLAIFWLMHLYDLHLLLGGTTEYANALNACSVGMMMVIVVSFVIPDFQISRSWLVLSWVLSASLVCIGRLALRRVAYYLRQQGLFVVPSIIIGTNAEAVALAHQLRNSLASGLAIVGFIDTDCDDGPLNNRTIDSIPIIGNLDSLPHVVRERGIKEVIIASTSMSREQLIQIPERLAVFPAVQMRLSSGLYEIFTTGMRITTKNSVPLMSLNQLRLDRMELAVKTLLDCSLILVSVPFLAPFFAIIAALIKMDSAGPVFYRRRVMGIGGKEFDAFKFRTMHVNGDEILAQHPELAAELQMNHKLKDDPRITRMGRLLRATSLDELPQLINVLRGEMSLVGPRMISPEERIEYGQMQLNLFTVKPGLTGLWQVSGRSDLSYAERVQLDMHYIRNYSIWLDLQILFFQTVPTVLKRRGAY
jgi:exopolysaccharide biosynthesis polyprenyl glycosylphosphotransferase